MAPQYILQFSVSFIYIIYIYIIVSNGHWMGWVGPNNRDFLGPELGTSEASAKWAPAVPSIFVQNNLEINSDV